MSTERDPVFGCELWQGRLDRDGYGFHGRSRAHIVAWEAVHGKIPRGLELEHRCRRRNCCAVHHLKLVTRSENELLKSWRRRVLESHCPRGHDMATNRIVVPPNGGIVCRTCNREAERQSA